MLLIDLTVHDYYYKYKIYILTNNGVILMLPALVCDYVCMLFTTSQEQLQPNLFNVFLFSGPSVL